MIVGIEGLPLAGKTTLMRAYCARHPHVRGVVEQVDHLGYVPPVPRTAKERMDNHALFLRVERQRAAAADPGDILLDRTFLSSIAFNRYLDEERGESLCGLMEREYRDAAQDGSLLVPDRVLLLTVSPAEAARRSLGGRDPWWMVPERRERMQRHYVDCLRSWGIPWRACGHTDALRMLEGLYGG